MNNLTKLVKQKTKYKKYPTLKRIKIGRGLFIIASLPLFTSWLYLFSIPMMVSISPNIWIKGKLNEIKGNGDLKLR